MMDYTELVKALRCPDFGDVPCSHPECNYWSQYACKARVVITDAAAAIEELDAEETRLLLITSELQDKVVELEEQLNDADIAADDNARQVEELQAEVTELKRVNMEIFEDLPKRGEWVRVEDAYSFYYECSVCRERPLYSRYGDIVLSGTCPNCGAKMTGEQDVE